MVVSPSNPIDSLTKDQIRQIFTGQLTDWSQVRGTAGRIQVYAGEEDDPFSTLALAGAPLLPLGPQYRFESGSALDTAVAADPSGIGSIGLNDAKHSKKIAVSEGGAEPLVPTRFTVETEDYPLSYRLYLYIPAHKPRKTAQDFVDFALSAERAKRG